MKPSEADFAAWIAPHWNAMTAVAGVIAEAADRDDVVQEAALLAWQRLQQFDERRGSARNWLLAITANSARKSHRWRRRIGSVQELKDVDRSTGTGVDARLDIDRAIETLSRRQREAVRLYYYAALSVEEVAAAMGCSPGTVKATLSTSRLTLRSALGKEYS